MKLYISRDVDGTPITYIIDTDDGLSISDAILIEQTKPGTFRYFTEPASELLERLEVDCPECGRITHAMLTDDEAHCPCNYDTTGAWVGPAVIPADLMGDPACPCPCHKGHQ